MTEDVVYGESAVSRLTKDQKSKLLAFAESPFPRMKRNLVNPYRGSKYGKDTVEGIRKLQLTLESARFLRKALDDYNVIGTNNNFTRVWAHTEHPVSDVYTGFRYLDYESRTVWEYQGNEWKLLHCNRTCMRDTEVIVMDLVYRRFI